MSIPRLLLCISALWFVGCTFERNRSFGVDPRRYLVVEDGRSMEMRLVIVDHEWMLTAPLDAAGAQYPILAESAPKNIDQAGRLFKTAPAWHVLAHNGAPNFATVALAIVPPLTQRGEPPVPEPVRWIISIKPIVIGVGDALERPSTTEIITTDWRVKRLYSTLRLITPRDLNETIHEIVVLDKWPEAWPKYDLPEMPEEILAGTLEPNVRRTQVPVGTSLRKVLKKPHLWTSSLRSD